MEESRRHSLSRSLLRAWRRKGSAERASDFRTRGQWRHEPEVRCSRQYGDEMEGEARRRGPSRNRRHPAPVGGGIRFQRKLLAERRQGERYASPKAWAATDRAGWRYQRLTPAE